MGQSYKHIIVPKRTTTATETIATDNMQGFMIGAVDASFRLVIYAAGAATDTLDVKLEESFDQDAYYPAWNAFAAFAQIAGSVADGTVEILKWSRSGSPETESATATTTLAAGNVKQGPVFPDIRVVATIGDVDTPSFEWALEAYVWREGEA